MTLYAISGAIESGLIYALLAFAVFISFRVMKVPDLSVDGTFTTGAAIASVMTVAGYPYLGLLLAFVAGGIAGSVTALLHVKLKIAPVLCGILTMTALYSVNLIIMNNQASIMINSSTPTCFSAFDFISDSFTFGKIVVPLLLIAVILFLLYRFFRSKTGLAVRATGDNETMVRSSSINTDVTKIIAMTVSNAFASLCGAFIASQQNYCDIKMGSGAIVLGLASLILGEVIIRGRKSIFRNLLAAVVGAVLYQLIISFALAININSAFLKLISAVIVVIALSVPVIKARFISQKERRYPDRITNEEVETEADEITDREVSKNA